MSTANYPDATTTAERKPTIRQSVFMQAVFGILVAKLAYWLTPEPHRLTLLAAFGALFVLWWAWEWLPSTRRRRAAQREERRRT